MALQAAECAMQFGIDGLDFSNETIQQREEASQRLQCLFSSTNTRTAEECLELGLAASKTGEFDTGLTALQRGRNILVGSSSWEMYLQLSCVVAEIHFQRGNYENTMETCQHILSTWTPTAHSLFLLRALFYLINSHIAHKQFSYVSNAQEWTGKFIAECSHCQFVLLLIESSIHHSNDKIEEAEQSIEMALQIDPSLSFISIFRMFSLAQILYNRSDLKNSKKTYKNVCDMYSIYFPHSLQYT